MHGSLSGAMTFWRSTTLTLRKKLTGCFIVFALIAFPLLLVGYPSSDRPARAVTEPPVRQAAAIELEEKEALRIRKARNVELKKMEERPVREQFLATRGLDNISQ
jgi:hypothetical protein